MCGARYVTRPCATCSSLLGPHHSPTVISPVLFLLVRKLGHREAPCGRLRFLTTKSDSNSLDWGKLCRLVHHSFSHSCIP